MVCSTCSRIINKITAGLLKYMVAKEREAWLSPLFSSLSENMVLMITHGKVRKPWEGPTRSYSMANKSADL